MILAKLACPLRKAAANLLEHDKSLIELDSVALAIVESYRLDMRKSL